MGVIKLLCWGKAGMAVLILECNLWPCRWAYVCSAIQVLLWENGNLIGGILQLHALLSFLLRHVVFEPPALWSVKG